jgi:hypothetical protein
MKNTDEILLVNWIQLPQDRIQWWSNDTSGPIKGKELLEPAKWQLLSHEGLCFMKEAIY